MRLRLTLCRPTIRSAGARCAFESRRTLARALRCTLVMSLTTPLEEGALVSIMAYRARLDCSVDQSCLSSSRSIQAGRLRRVSRFSVCRENARDDYKPACLADRAQRNKDSADFEHRIASRLGVTSECGRFGSTLVRRQMKEIAKHQKITGREEGFEPLFPTCDLPEVERVIWI